MRFIAIILVLVSLLSFTGRFGVMLSFKLNQNYVAKNLCENRFNKSSTCNGKCYLKKQLQKHDSKESESTHSHTKSKAEDFILQKDYLLSFNRTCILKEKNYTSFTLEGKISDYTSSVFHPPSI